MHNNVTCTYATTYVEKCDLLKWLKINGSWINPGEG